MPISPRRRARVRWSATELSEVSEVNADDGEDGDDGDEPDDHDHPPARSPPQRLPVPQNREKSSLPRRALDHTIPDHTREPASGWSSLEYMAKAVNPLRPS